MRSSVGVKAVVIYNKKQVRQGRRRIGVQDKQSYVLPGSQDRNRREHPGQRCDNLNNYVDM